MRLNDWISATRPSSRLIRMAALGSTSVFVALGATNFAANPVQATPNCTQEMKSIVPQGRVTLDGHAEFSWMPIEGVNDFQYSFTSFTNGAWTPWSSWISLGRTTNIRIPFSIVGPLRPAISIAVAPVCYGDAYLPPSSRVDFQTLPEAPTIKAIDRVERGLKVTLADQTTNFAGPVTAIRVFASPGDHRCDVPVSYGGWLVFGECVLEGLTPGQEYIISAEAQNDLGRGPRASGTSFRVATAPAPPRNFRVRVNGTAASAQWSQPEFDGGLAIKEYRLRTIPNGKSCVVAANQRTLGCEIRGLRPGQGYAFEVVAVSDFGDSTAARTGTRNVVTTPSAPRNVSAGFSGGDIQVVWTVPSSTGGVPITGYRVRVNGARTVCETKQLRCTITGLRAGSTYRFNVVARNARGSGPSVQTNAVGIPKPPQEIS